MVSPIRTQSVQSYPEILEMSLSETDEKIKKLGKVISCIGIGMFFSLSLISKGIACEESTLKIVGIYLFVPIFCVFTSAGLIGLILFKKRDRTAQLLREFGA